MNSIHLIAELGKRMCGAETVPGLAAGSNVRINNLVPAVEGDRNTHTNLGMLINILSHNVNIGGIPAIAALADMASPDVIGLTTHVQGFPIPIGGSPNVKIGQGNNAAALGSFGLSGPLQIGELVSVGSQVIGMVQNFTSIGGQGGVAQIGNLTPGVTASPGQTLVGQTSGNSFTATVYIDSRDIYPGLDSVSSSAVVTDSGDYITLESYEDLYPSINLTSALVTTT